MASQVRTAFLAREEPGSRSIVCPTEQLWKCSNTLFLRTLRGFEGVEALGGGLHFTFHMGGEIAPSKDPFGRWIGVELAIFALPMLHDIPTPFAGIDNGMTGSPVEAAACLFHKDTIRTWFNRDTFHRFSILFYA